LNGHKDADGKFHPHNDTSNKLSSHQVESSKHGSVNHSDANKLKNKKIKPRNVTVTDNNYTFQWDEDGIHLSLGNMTDAGWYWSGNQDDVVDFLVRLYGTEEDSGKYSQFEKEMKAEGVGFNDLKSVMLKSIQDGDGVYTLSGDSSRWRFNDGDEDYQDMEYILDGDVIAGLITQDEKEKIDEIVWDFYKVDNYEDYYPKYKQHYIDVLTKAIKESNSFDDFGAEIDNLSDNDDDKREEIHNAVYTAIGQAKERLGIVERG
jgi:hypothetical protein